MTVITIHNGCSVVLDGAKASLRLTRSWVEVGDQGEKCHTLISDSAAPPRATARLCSVLRRQAVCHPDTVRGQNRKFFDLKKKIHRW